MNRNRRLKAMEEDFQRVRDLEETKGREYASEQDTLENFKQCGAGMTPFQVWWVYFFKHLKSIDTAIARNPKYPDFLSEPHLSRTGDLMNYLTLFNGLMEDLNPNG